MMSVFGLIYFLLFSLYAALFFLNSSVVLLLVHLASRLAYFGYVSTALNSDFFSKKYGAKVGFKHFKTIAQAIMNNDAFTLILLCLVSRDSFGYLTDYNSNAFKVIGLLMIVIGGSIKLWAASLLKDGYYWADFFFPASHGTACKQGPYRFLDNPMYTVGYLPAYGLAIFFCSPLGLAAACFDQLLILYFNQTTEVPHYQGVKKLRAVELYTNGQPSLT